MTIALRQGLPDHALHIPAVINPQMTDVGPPEGNASDSDADRAVHEFKIAKASPSIASGLKWRFNSALWPIEARCAASSKARLCCLSLAIIPVSRALMEVGNRKPRIRYIR